MAFTRTFVLIISTCSCGFRVIEQIRGGNSGNVGALPASAANIRNAQVYIYNHNNHFAPSPGCVKTPRIDPTELNSLDATMHLLNKLVAIAALASSVYAAPTSQDDKLAQPIPPKQDPWYTAPANFQSAKPGEILRVRQAPGNLAEVVGNCSAAYNILYRTTGSLSNPTWAVTTLFVPRAVSPCTPKPKGYGSVLSYQIAYDSANLDQSPSYQLYTGPPADISDALGRGWYVNVPDYEGPLASFTAGHMSGYATLDSVRAVLASPYGVAKDARYALWGYSGGALASEWAAELQPSYASDMHFSGAALGGLTPNISSVLHAVKQQVSAFLGVQGILGLASQHPDVEKVLLSKLKDSGPFNKTGFLAITNMTSQVAAFTFLGADISQYFDGGFALLDDPVVADVISTDGIMGKSDVPKMPIYSYKAINDEISPVADTDQLMKEYCSKGATLLYERNTVGGHVAEATNGEAAAIAFLESVLQGESPVKGCTIRDTTVKLSDSSLRRRWIPHLGLIEF